MSNPSTLKYPGLPKSKSGVKTPEPAGPYEDWHAYFEQELREILQDSKKITTYWDYFVDYNKFFDNTYNNFLKRISPRCKGWRTEAQELYRLSGVLFIITELEKITVRRGMVSHGDFIERYEKELINSFPRRLTDDLLEEKLPILLKLADVARNSLLSKGGHIFDWQFLYRLLWSNVFCYSPMVEKEMIILRRTIKKAGRGTSDQINAGIALAHLMVLQGEDHKAWEIFEGLGISGLGYVVFYLHAFSRSEEWNRLLVWLRWIDPKLERATEHDFEVIGQYWSVAAEHGGAFEEYIANLKKWLPRSRYAYSEFLLVSKRFTDWADLHSSLWLQFPGEITREEMRYVEVKEPSAVLPLYHRLVIQLIEEKNRGSYHQAVKVLKKIRILYNKQKMAGEWDVFIQRLVARYPRSRALHEEMRKGKLIS